MKMVKFSILLIISFFSLFLYNCDMATEPDPVDDIVPSSNYTLIWSDEFDQDTTALDPENWNIETGYGNDGWGNDEWELYTNSSENIKVENGNMVIAAIFDSVNFSTPGKRDGSVTSSRVNTKDKFDLRYGKIQARIKVPTGMGMWPAFWMLGKNVDTVSWPNCGEIDIMEVSPYMLNTSTTIFAAHWGIESSPYPQSYTANKDIGVPLSDDYHVYEIEWDQLRIVGKIDGITFFIKVIDPVEMSEYFNKFFMIFNVAVGGTLGGAPDATTEWPQMMYVDWVRAYQVANENETIKTYGIFTDNTPVDAELTVGADAQIYVWENTLTAGNILPYEGDNGMTFSTTGEGWFGGGIASNQPLDLSDFESGNINFMIKIPANVTFKIGIIDSENNESYVLFPAGQNIYDLKRDGEWGQVVIPVKDIKGNVDLEMLNYEFVFIEESGIQCEFAIDDIYWTGGGSPANSIIFDSETITVDSTGTDITVSDIDAANTLVTVQVINDVDTINIDINIDPMGVGKGRINFGTTDDATDTIEISENDKINIKYLDSYGVQRSANAIIEVSSIEETAGVYTESHNDITLNYTTIINSANWSGDGASPDVMSTAVTPVDGTYVLAVDFTYINGSWAGIAFDYSSYLHDISSYTTVVVNINSSGMTDLAHLWLKFEDNAGSQVELDLYSYTPIITGDWSKYEIPLSDFSAVDLSAIKYLLFVNPFNSGNNLIYGSLYFDDIYIR
ncbi:MAG: family 16 glycosylhydrolase [Candidatus Delongbacteria bacterium]|jgi:beta-glucanase (GH16 family)|nr:family 16 glycosylhydrolase [Candidatus Delongbacteria bacterium]